MADMNDAIAAAKLAAANIVDAEVTHETLPATSNHDAVPVNYTRPSMESRSGSKGIGQAVAHWLKVDEFGLSIDADRKKLEEVLVEIDMTEGLGFMVKDTIKWGNTPVNYASLYEGQMADNGQPWGEVVQRAMRADPRAKVFPSADIILTVVDPIEQSKGAEPIAVGVKVGLTLSMSNWRNWEVFYGEVSKAGLIGQNVKARLHGQEVLGKKNGLTWGVVAFDLIV